MAMSSIEHHAYRPPSRLSAQLGLMREDEPRFTAAGLGFLMAIPLFAAAGALDDRLHLGVDIWLKPAKFALALGVYLLTLAFTARFLPESYRNSAAYRAFSVVVVAACAAEMAWIAGAAALGTSSHFNVATSLASTLYGLMGVLATTLTSASSVHAVGIWRNKRTGLSQPMREALILGLGLTLPLTLLTAGTMSHMNGHAVGGTGLDTAGLPLMGWLSDAGDLRVGHFFATHALHFIPAFGLMAVMLTGNRAIWPVRLFAFAFTGFVVFTFVQALAGNPFLAALG
jgi:hypothetical protein